MVIDAQYIKHKLTNSYEQTTKLQSHLVTNDNDGDIDHDDGDSDYDDGDSDVEE